MRLAGNVQHDRNCMKTAVDPLVRRLKTTLCKVSQDADTEVENQIFMLIETSDSQPVKQSKALIHLAESKSGLIRFCYLIGEYLYLANQV
jgi:hypothetical protein